MEAESVYTCLSGDCLPSRKQHVLNAVFLRAGGHADYQQNAVSMCLHLSFPELADCFVRSLACSVLLLAKRQVKQSLSNHSFSPELCLDGIYYLCCHLQAWWMQDGTCRPRSVSRPAQAWGCPEALAATSCEGLAAPYSSCSGQQAAARAKALQKVVHTFWKKKRVANIWRKPAMCHWLLSHGNIRNPAVEYWRVNTSSCQHLAKTWGFESHCE